MSKSRERSKRVRSGIIAAADTGDSDQCPRCAGVGKVQALCKVREVRQGAHGSVSIFYYVPRPMSCVSCSGTGVRTYIIKASGCANPVQLTPDGSEQWQAQPSLRRSGDASAE